MTTRTKKCRAKGGVSACKNPNCPEKQNQVVEQQVFQSWLDNATEPEGDPVNPMLLADTREGNVVPAETFMGRRIAGIISDDLDKISKSVLKKHFHAASLRSDPDKDGQVFSLTVEQPFSYHRRDYVAGERVLFDFESRNSNTAARMLEDVLYSDGAYGVVSK